MLRGKRAGMIAGLAIVLILVAVIFRGSNRVRTRLPTGPVTPSVSLADNYGMILAGDGSLWVWGAESPGNGILGLGAVTNQVPLRRIGSETNWVQVLAGGYHCLALKSDGTMWTWGVNLHRALFGNPKYVTAPMLNSTNAPVPAAPGNDWARIANGGIHNLALKKDGTLWAWGFNWSGQLGIGSTTDSVVPVQVGSASNWTRIWGGALQSVGQQSDGSLWVWGDNPIYPMGTNSLTTPARLSPDTNWVDVGSGQWSAFGVKADGTLWVWGRTAKCYEEPRDKALDAAFARAGSSNWSSHFFENMGSATPLRVGTNSDWKAVAGSEWWYTLLQKKDGSIWELDATEYDELGRPPSQYRPVTLRRMELPKDIVSFAAGREVGIHPVEAEQRIAGAVLTREGEVWTWGNAMGEARPSQVATFLAKGAYRLHLIRNMPKLEPKAVFRAEPWLLPNVEPGAAGGK